jgi:hypothetical protein
MQEFLIKNGVIVNDPGITANNLLVLDTNKKLIDTGIPYTTVTTLDNLANISAALQSEYNNLNYVVRLTGNQSISGHKVFKDTVEIDGDLIVNGNQLIVNSISISAKDNQIILNAGEVGTGVSAGYAGFRVDRGTLPYYDFQFRESDDAFILGISGDYQAVATREDAPIHAAFTYWDSGNDKLLTYTEFTTASFISKSEVFAISSNLQNQINSISISAGSGLAVSETSNNNWVLSITGSFGDASLRAEVGVVTGYLNDNLTQLYSTVGGISSNYINYQTVASISSSLNSSINSLSGQVYNQSLQISNISATNITQTQNIIRLQSDMLYLASVTGSFATTTSVASLTGQLTPLTATASLTAQLQPFSVNLSALSNYNTNGFIVQTAPNTFVGRSISPGSGISIGNGNGGAGNPTIAVNDYISKTEVVDISSYLNDKINSLSSSLSGVGITITGGNYINITEISSNLYSIEYTGIQPDIFRNEIVNITSALQAEISALQPESTQISAGYGLAVYQYGPYSYALEVTGSFSSAGSITGAYVSTLNGISGAIQLVATNGITASQSGNTITIGLSAATIIGGIQGRVQCVSGQTSYIITHTTIDQNVEFPVVSLEVSDANDDIFVQGIYDRQPTSFKVVLGGTPDSSHAILYHISTQNATSMNNLVFTTGNQTISGEKTFSNDLTINGKLTVTGLIDPTGLELTPISSNPGISQSNTIWINSADSNKWYIGNTSLNSLSSSGSGSNSSLSVNNIQSVNTIIISGDGVSVTNNGNGIVSISISGSSVSSSNNSTMLSVTGNSFTPNGNYDSYSYTLNGHATMYCPTDMADGQSKTIRIKQPADVYSLSFANDPPYVWKFSNANPPVITSQANAIDILTILKMDTDVYVTVIKNFLEVT